MLTDIFLIGLTLAVAVIGTLHDHPSRKTKVVLIGFAVGTSLGSIVKAAHDDTDKEFLKKALVTTLTPSNAVYKNLISDVDNEFRKSAFNEYDCNHTDGTLTCYLWSKEDNTKHATLVLNNSEVSEMYANEIARDTNSKVLQTACARTYNPGQLEEDFKDKVGILGSSVLYNMYGRGSSANYDDKFGVRIEFQDDGKTKEVSLTPDELVAFKEGKACNLFHELEQRFRQKFSQELSPAKKGASAEPAH